MYLLHLFSEFYILNKYHIFKRKTEEKTDECKCYGCTKRLLCKCRDCILSIDCKLSFCLFKNTQKTFECKVCFSKFRTYDYLLNHRKRTNHRTKSKLNENLPKAKWIDLYFCGKFENDLGVRNMTNSKVIRYDHKPESENY